jgi:hypothetical protein
LLCYNPILVIALSAEFLYKIGNSISIFKHDGKILSNQLIQLGRKIIENMEGTVVSKVFLDVDFLDRTVLKIITNNGFAPLMQNPNVNILLEELWVGKNTYECDGTITDFSLITYLFSSRIKKLPGKYISPVELLGNNFKISINDEKFWYQYKFRHSSISYIFMKDFICSIMMVLLFIFITFKYLTLFRVINFLDLDELT